ncbi:hypothetical protein [Pseudodesulfovibrio karagichevae]|uniref:Uncharacterized protein n=1 Tax=Pseudodesulfovibrio karagichevae TaxID=3239305 RepID=A0ABV4K2A9_9BACT
MANDLLDYRRVFTLDSPDSGASGRADPADSGSRASMTVKKGTPKTE